MQATHAMIELNWSSPGSLTMIILSAMHFAKYQGSARQDRHRRSMEAGKVKSTRSPCGQHEDIPAIQDRYQDPLFLRRLLGNL